MKKDRMLSVLVVIAVIFMIICGCRLIWLILRYQEADNLYADIGEEVLLPELPSEDDENPEEENEVKQAVDFQNLLSINEEIVAWILIHSSMRDCSIESLVMEGTALNGMYFFRTQPKYLRGEKSMSVTLGGAAEEEVENYRRLVKVGIVPKEKNRGNAVLMEGKVM